jgi:hypothetical protein
VNNFTSANTIEAAQTICETNIAALTGNAVTGDGLITYKCMQRDNIHII